MGGSLHCIVHRPQAIMAKNLEIVMGYPIHTGDVTESEAAIFNVKQIEVYHCQSQK